MKVICPKCQFENQADSLRVVCARCATIIEVSMDQPSSSDSNGKRQTARLPFAASPGTSQTSNSQASDSQQLNQPPDAYATRIGDEFDDVLDIPRPAQSNYQTGYESSGVYDDVFTTPGYDSTAAYDYSATERKPTTPIESFRTGTPRQRETQDYVTSAEPEFMGWPVLPENSIEEEEQASGFSGGRGGLLARILVIVLIFGGLISVAYYFLGDMIGKRKDQATNLVTGGPSSGNQSGGKAGEKAPAAAPGAAVKSGETGSQPADSAKTNQSATANDPKTTITPPVINPKPSQPVDDKSQPANTDKSGAKPVDIPPVPVTGPSGPSQSPIPAPAPATPNKGNITIQVASYSDRTQADERANRLKASQIDARVVRAEIPGRGTWHRVQIGGFATREEATTYGNQLKSKRILEDFIVTTK